LTQQLLAYSGKGYYESLPHNLNDIVNEMANILEVSISKQASLHKDLENSLPVSMIDSGQMQQVIMNLIVNASDAIGGERGDIFIRTGVRSIQEDEVASSDHYLKAGPYVYLEVEDTGCGMDEDTRQRMFDPFFTTKTTGRGLGMAAVLGIVHAHKGAITVESQPGEGSLFTILLPVSDKESEPVPQKKTDTDKSWRGTGTVLLVDDEETVRMVGSRMLQRFGFKVDIAVDGEEAIRVLYKNQNPEQTFRAVMLDMTMPRRSGKSVIRMLRNDGCRIPIILTSGFDPSGLDEELDADPHTEFLQKPYRMDRLREVLQTLLVK
jgi:CheY-like chemotaxis protein